MQDTASSSFRPGGRQGETPDNAGRSDAVGPSQEPTSPAGVGKDVGTDARHTPGPWVPVEFNENCPLPGGAFLAVHTAAEPFKREGGICELIAQGVGGRYSPEITSANGHLIAASPDHALLLAAIVAGRARWTPYQHNPTLGEVSVGGFSHLSRLDDFGCPVLTPLLREALR